MKIKIINGVNLGQLGTREISIYGSTSFEEYFQTLVKQFPNLQLEYFQTDSEEEIVKQIHASQDVDGIVLNPGAFTHTSIILADAVKSVQTPVIEVHISNLFGREQYRRKSYLSGCCAGFISGFGLRSYELAIQYFAKN